MKNSKKYSIRFRIWIDEEKGPFLGLGKVILLQKIKETGSITRAAQSIKMSYRQAWQLVEDMNARANKPLVKKHLGGKTGGGADITPEGENAIAQFYTLEKNIHDFINKEYKKIKW